MSPVSKNFENDSFNAAHHASDLAMDDADESIWVASAPARVSLAPFLSSAPRRLCSRATVRKPVAWISLQGRLVGAQEATSAAAIGGGMSREEAVGWELFSPLQRVLIVALVAVATKESKRSRIISQLQRSVGLRDQVLESMQQKLEDLCEQMNFAQNQPMSSLGKISSEGDLFHANEISKLEQAECRNCGHRALEFDLESGIVPLYMNPCNGLKDVDGNESAYSEILMTNIQEERRMSDLSFCSSVTSSDDIQLSSLAIEQDFYNLRKECEEKDATIKELTNTAHATRVMDSKRIMELEETIRRKCMVITKLKEDVVVLEQKVVQLTRLGRSSASSNINHIQLPRMANNLIYDMSSTSPSSSDSDSPTKDNIVEFKDLVPCEISENHQTPISPKSHITIRKSVDRLSKQRSASPNQIFRRDHSAVALRKKRSGSCSSEVKRSKSHAPQKKWV